MPSEDTGIAVGSRREGWWEARRAEAPTAVARELPVTQFRETRLAPDYGVRYAPPDRFEVWGGVQSKEAATGTTRRLGLRWQGVMPGLRVGWGGIDVGLDPEHGVSIGLGPLSVSPTAGIGLGAGVIGWDGQIGWAPWWMVVAHGALGLVSGALAGTAQRPEQIVGQTLANTAASLVPVGPIVDLVDVGRSSAGALPELASDSPTRRENVRAVIASHLQRGQLRSALRLVDGAVRSAEHAVTRAEFQHLREALLVHVQQDGLPVAVVVDSETVQCSTPIGVLERLITAAMDRIEAFRGRYAAWLAGDPAAMAPSGAELDVYWGDLLYLAMRLPLQTEPDTTDPQRRVVIGSAPWAFATPETLLRYWRLLSLGLRELLAAGAPVQQAFQDRLRFAIGRVVHGIGEAATSTETVLQQVTAAEALAEWWQSMGAQLTAGAEREAFVAWKIREATDWKSSAVTREAALHELAATTLPSAEEWRAGWHAVIQPMQPTLRSYALWRVSLVGLEQLQHAAQRREIDDAFAPFDLLGPEQRPLAREEAVATLAQHLDRLDMMSGENVETARGRALYRRMRHALGRSRDATVGTVAGKATLRHGRDAVMVRAMALVKTFTSAAADLSTDDLAMGRLREVVTSLAHDVERLRAMLARLHYGRGADLSTTLHLAREERQEIERLLRIVLTTLTIERSRALGACPPEQMQTLQTLLAGMTQELQAVAAAYRHFTRSRAAHHLAAQRHDPWLQALTHEPRKSPLTPL